MSKNYNIAVLLSAFLFLLLFSSSVLAVNVLSDPSRIGVGARPLGMGKAFVGLFNSLFNTIISDTDPYRQGVDEHAHHAVRGTSCLHAAKKYGAEHNIIAVAYTGQHQPPGKVKYARRTDAKQTGALAKSRRQRCGQTNAGIAYIRSITPHVKKSEGCGWFFHLF